MLTNIMKLRMELTKKDELILKNLHGVKMPSYADISLKTGLPESTVRYRIERMEKMGIIRGYSAIIDPKTLGLHMAVVMCDELSQRSIFFNTVGSVGCISVLLGSYDELYSSIARNMKNGNVKEVLPVLDTNITLTTLNLCQNGAREDF